MFEKNGSIVLTEDDVRQYNAGVVSKRLQELWGLSLDDLRNFFVNNQVSIITTNGQEDNESGQS